MPIILATQEVEFRGLWFEAPPQPIAGCGICACDPSYAESINRRILGQASPGIK
jgi:hypothetical protein